MDRKKIGEYVEEGGLCTAYIVAILIIVLQLVGVLHFDLEDIIVMVFAASIGFMALGRNMQHNAHKTNESQAKSKTD
jgi:hypothetical protein